MNELTADRLRSLLRYEPETGALVRLVTTSNNARAGMIAGCPKDGYLVTRIDGVLYRNHRLAWLWMTGEWPKCFVDHRNTNRGDDRWSNLREATPSFNQQNRRAPQKNNKTGYIGVFKSPYGFLASIRIDGKSINLRHHATAELAYETYLAAKRALHPGGTL